MADGSAITMRDMDALARASQADKAAGKRSGLTRQYKVDIWATDLNTTEIGILKRTQHEAQSDQFTKDMEIIGQTVDGGKREGLIAYRKELWDEKKDMERRLVVKLFSETMGWRGTLELMLGRSLQLSNGAGVAVPAFSVNLARHGQLIQLERCARKWPLMPERFTFFIQGKSGTRFYTVKRHWVSFGADYSVYDQKGRRIGILDQRVVNLGGAWKVKLDPDQTDRKLETVLELFCVMLKYNRSARGHVAKTLARVKEGRILPKLSHREADLYDNPRTRR